MTYDPSVGSLFRYFCLKNCTASTLSIWLINGIDWKTQNVRCFVNVRCYKLTVCSPMLCGCEKLQSVSFCINRAIDGST